MVKTDLDTCKQLLATPEPPALGPQRRAGTLSEPDLSSALETLLSRRQFSPRQRELLRALLLLWHDHLDAAHTLAQASETADGNFIHAILHRREPDSSNSKYWWRSVGNHPCFQEMSRRVDELRALVGDVPLEVLPHVAFKHLAQTAKATIRTGDTTPYANIIIVSG